MSKNSSFLFLVGGVFVAACLMAVLANQAAHHSRIVIDWETASELNTAGFNVYRGETRDQIDTRLNSQLLPPATDPLQGQAYQYVDPNVIPGKTYYYLVEEMDLSGVSQNFGPLEVRAEGGGALDLIFAILLGGIGLVGFFYWLVKLRQGPE